jgi:hypothetical protein
MSKHCVFNSQWCDINLNPEIAVWISPIERDPTAAYCKVCVKTFKLSNMGRQAVMSHANGPKHKNNLSIRNSYPKIDSFGIKACSMPNVLQKEPLPSSTGDVDKTQPDNQTINQTLSESNSVMPNLGKPEKKQCDMKSLVINNDDITSAEIIWALEVVTGGMSLNSCSRSTEAFRRMFHDSQIAQRYSMGKTKASYIITHGIAPYFKEGLINEVKNKCSDYVICFDESLNKISQRCQMDLFVRFWDSSKEEVSTRYLNSMFLGRSKAEDLLNSFIEGVPFSLENLLQVSMDGPNVNKSFLEKLNAKLSIDNPDGKELVDIGVCTLHTVNGALKTSLQNVKWNIHKVLHAMYGLLKNSPARRSMYTQITGSTEFARKFCSVRWVENVSCLERAIYIYDNIQKFIKEVTLAQPNCHLETLQEEMKDPLLKAKLAAFKCIASDLEPFLRRFQGQQPLVPFLYSHLLETVRNLMSRVVRTSKLNEATTAQKVMNLDLKDSDTLLPIEKVDIGYSAKHIMKKLKCSDKEKYMLKKDFSKIVISVIEKLKEKSPLKSNLARGLTCFDPDIILNKPTLGQTRVDSVLEILHNSKRITDVQAENAKKQYTLLTVDEKVLPKLTTFKENHSTDDGRLDQLFSSTIGKDKKYMHLWDVIKLCFILSHGNAAVESGFSVNKNLLVENLLEDSLTSQRMVYDTVTAMGGVQHVVITRQLLISVRGSRKKYEDHLQQKKKQETLEETKRKEKRKLEAEIRTTEEQTRKLKLQRDMEEQVLQKRIRELQEKKSAL